MADTVISKGILIDGELTGSEPVFVEGVVKGRIDLDSSVTIGPSGLVEADIYGDEVEINGQVTGSVTARDRAEIKTDGRMVGDIKAPRILIADGAGFKGRIDMDVD